MYTAYNLWMAGSIALCALLYTLCTHKKLRCWSLGIVSMVFGVLVGAALAKLTYYFTQFDYVRADGLLYSLYDPTPSKWSIFGGAAGVTLGVFLSAKATRTRPADALNLFAPIGALMLALARFGCFFLQDDLIGCGAYVEEAAWTFFPLTISNEWGEHYLAVFMLEALCAAVVALASVLCFRKHRALRTAFYLCLTQILCESLHSDSISWLFVRVEQLFCMLALAAVIIVYVVRTPASPKRLLPFWVCLGCAALFVGIEFALDKSDLPILLLYALMIAGLGVLGWAEHNGLRRLRGSETVSA